MKKNKKIKKRRKREYRNIKVGGMRIMSKELFVRFDQICIVM